MVGNCPPYIVRVATPTLPFLKGPIPKKRLIINLNQSGLRKINFALHSFAPMQNKFCTPFGPSQNKFCTPFGPSQNKFCIPFGPSQNKFCTPFGPSQNKFCTPFEPSQNKFGTKIKHSRFILINNA